MRVKQQVLQRMSQRPGQRFVRSKLSAAVTRHFTRLDASAAHCYESSSLINFGFDDFVIKFKAYRTSDTVMGVVGNTALSNRAVTLRNNGVVRIGVAGVSVETGAGVVGLNRLDSIEIRRISGVAEIIVNGITEASGDLPGSFAVDIFGRITAGVYLDGYLSDIEIYHSNTLMLYSRLDHPIPADGIIANEAAGNPGAPSHLTAVNLLPTDSEKYTFNNDGWENSAWPNLLPGTRTLSGTGTSRMTKTYDGQVHTLTSDATPEGGAEVQLQFSYDSVAWTQTLSAVIEPGTATGVLFRLSINGSWCNAVFDLQSRTASYLDPNFDTAGVADYRGRPVVWATISNRTSYLLQLQFATLEKGGEAHFYEDPAGGSTLLLFSMQLEDGTSVTLPHSLTDDTVAHRLEVAS